jgi:hypothetical protein
MSFGVVCCCGCCLIILIFDATKVRVIVFVSGLKNLPDSLDGEKKELI